MVLSLFIVFFTLRLISSLEKGDDTVTERLELSKTANPLRTSMQAIRIRCWFVLCALLILISLMHVGGSSLSGLMFWFAIFYGLSGIPISYFLACTPKPRNPYRQYVAVHS